MMPLPGPVRIRRYEPGDRDAILALAPRLAEGRPAWRDSAAWLDAVAGWIADAAASAAAPDHVVYVAVDGEQVVGVVHAAERTHFTGQTDAYVGELITAPARGLDYLTLETGMANHNARALYTALGYLEEDVRLTKRIG
jgi:ribosomal protein S18 acetylase RimI-like enzyme